MTGSERQPEADEELRADSSAPDEPTSSAFGFLEHWFETYGGVARSAVMLAVFFAALWLLHHEFKSMRYSDVVASFHALSTASIVAAIVLTAANFAVLIGYDWFGVRLVTHPVTGRQVATASLLSYAFSNSLGVYLGGAPVRVRLYSAWGMPPSQIARLVLVIGVAFWMGLFCIAGVLFLFTPFAIPERFHLPMASSRPLGYVLLGLLAVFLLACQLRKSPLRIMGVNVQPPPLKIALAQMLVAMSDFVLAASVLYVLLPSETKIAFLPFVAIFVLAIFVALVSNVPGGLGVLELVLVTMLPGDPHGLVGSLVAFRIIYYLLPLMLAVVTVAVMAGRQHAARIAGSMNIGMRWLSIIAPRIITLVVFAAGAVLLISGSLPVSGNRIDRLLLSLPLSVVEFSHFLGSVIGAALLVVARGLQRRIDAAYWMTLGLLASGAVVSLLKGLNYAVAILFVVLLLSLLPCRSYFYRRGRLLASRFSPGWLAAVVMISAVVVWLILFAYRHVEYDNELWWSFAYHGQASRSMRAAVGAAVVIALFLLMRLLRATADLPSAPTEDEMKEVAAIVKTDAQTSSNLALLGDKRFIFSEDRKAFVMFGGEGNCWVSMGDPVGPADSADDAAWKFREACDAQGVWPVFYQVDGANLGRYVEMGLKMLKLGEDARVPLSDFSLAKCSRNVRRTNKKSLESGLEFRVLPREEVVRWMPKLKEISDSWLGEKAAAEKGFSLGWFEEEYLAQFDMVMVFQGDAPVAFANIWRGADGTEVSPDLMRHMSDAPHGVMEFLFVQIMLWGREQGYEYFSLGMAPLSGVDAHRLGPAWNRVSNLIYQHGEHFYNFQGLRTYKGKFHPEWFPRYLASPGGTATPRILADVSTLISGGLVRLIKR